VSAPYEKWLARWMSGGVLDAGSAERIRAYETRQGSSEKLRWPVLLAVAFGGLLLAAGVLLFVSAHWDEISPTSRFLLVLLMVAIFPIGGALTAERFPVLSTTLFAVGTVCTGAGIFLSAQIFNLQAHWPNGILLWAIGALVAWLVLKEWPQAMLLGLLVPAWLAGEWDVRIAGRGYGSRLLALGLLSLAFTYLSARTNEKESAARKSLVYIGGIFLLPIASWAFATNEDWVTWRGNVTVSTTAKVLAWTIAIAGPFAVAYLLRGSKSVWNLAAAAWVLVIATFHSANHDTNNLLVYAWNSLGPYLWAAIGAAGLVGWGLLEGRKERINLGVAGFAFTVVVFYFSNVMDKLGRSASLIGMGLLLLFGGWILEKTRRRLVRHMEKVAS
jgi:hypothetical protein